MSGFTHINKVRYTYNAGGVNEVKEISVTETASAEINISEAHTLLAPVTGSTRHQWDITGFDFATKATAKSVYIRLDGTNGGLSANGDFDAGTEMVSLKAGVPYVWSDNATANHPVGATNPMVDATLKLTVKPDSYDETNNPLNVVDNIATLTVKVLYDPTP